MSLPFHISGSVLRTPEMYYSTTKLKHEIAFQIKSQDSWISGLTTDWTTKIRFPVGAGGPRYHVHTGSGVHPVLYPSGAEGLWPGVKRPISWSDSGTEVKNAWSVTLTPHMRHHGMVLSSRDNNITKRLTLVTSRFTSGGVCRLHCALNDVFNDLTCGVFMYRKIRMLHMNVLLIHGEFILTVTFMQPFF
jgi:hypothetical protein